MEGIKPPVQSQDHCAACQSRPLVIRQIGRKLNEPFDSIMDPVMLIRRATFRRTINARFWLSVLFGVKN